MNVYARIPRAPVETWPPRAALRDLSVAAYAQGRNHWIYEAGAHTLADVCTPGYFDDAARVFRSHDLLTIHGDGYVAQRWTDVAADGVVLRGLS